MTANNYVRQRGGYPSKHLMQHHSTESTTSATPDIRELRRRILAEVSRVVVGLDHVADQLLIAMVAGGHVLMEGVPGTAKTTLCKTFARLLGVDFQRIQFTPDLLPGDVTGTYTVSYTHLTLPTICSV